MTNLTQTDKDEFLDKHLRHRLTLLRTFRERKILGHNYQGEGDIYRCVKDSNLIAVRLILDFLGLRGECVGTAYSLVTTSITSRRSDDIKIDQFGFQLLTPADIPQVKHRLLAGVYKRADKELAHLTSTFNDEFNEEDILIEAATIVEGLLEKYLYTPLGKQLPEMNK
ncbi:MAG: hypothetical protein IPI66_10035 [Chitinophagaceae bacterium]|nr:hypothetical protein [Chitinophagaceae bacterium]